ncbi:hypothetical protein VTN00DRAFT_8381, partial [Thermoascus crustaceus]|uniref:uncharacterized protein n=1 Tax=Thermoascus crustaceus TaxID=5088 RepID=UPI003742ECCC
MEEIEKQFKDSAFLEIQAHYEDIQSYLDGQMFRLPSFVSRNLDLQREIKSSISEAVKGMFLLAQLYLDSLIGKRSPRAIRTALQKLPSGSEAYDYAYNEAMERIQSQNLNSQELAKQILGWIVCAQRPLTTTELQHALAVEIGLSELDEDNLPEIEDMTSVCAGLVTVDDKSNIIRLVHYTTQEYFERTLAAWFPNAHQDIATICITYLSLDIFETGFCPTDEELETRLQQYPLYDYSARNWGHHGRAQSVDEQLVLNLLENEAKMSACTQALMAQKGFSRDTGYSQRVPRQMTAVHLAAYFGLSDLIRRLLGNESIADVKDTFGRTSLSRAAEEGHEAVVQLLLEKDVDADYKDKYGQTPLSWAAGKGHEAVVQLLLEKGVDADSKDKYGQTPLSWAAGKGHEA